MLPCGQQARQSNPWSEPRRNASLFGDLIGWIRRPGACVPPVFGRGSGRVEPPHVSINDNLLESLDMTAAWAVRRRGTGLSRCAVLVFEHEPHSDARRTAMDFNPITAATAATLTALAWKLAGAVILLIIGR